jgi:hypothetical protein
VQVQQLDGKLRQRYAAQRAEGVILAAVMGQSLGSFEREPAQGPLSGIH